MTQKVLLVDDELNLLQSLRRGFRGQFELDLAEGGLAGLQMIRNNGPYAVVVSDMRMPQVTGLQVLAEAKRLAPDTIRIMLTGNADQKTASDAVNEGEVFRFVSKPCPSDELANTIHAALRLYERNTAEKAVLSKTLTGSVGLITEVLSMVNPTAFGQAGKLRQMAKRLCDKLGVADAWQIEVAAMLSQVGCVAVPEPILQKVYGGQTLHADERAIYESHPRIGSQLVAKIPRLELVAEMIAKQFERPRSRDQFPGLGPHTDARQRVEFGAFVLRLLIEFNQLAEQYSLAEAIERIQSNSESYHPSALLDAISELTVGRLETRLVHVRDLQEKMVLDEHVVTNAGDVLIAKGHEVTSSLIQRLWVFERTALGVRQPFRVRCHVLSKGSSAGSSADSALEETTEENLEEAGSVVG